MAGSRGKVLVAMSGGVDSSVAAAMLLREGYEVVGCFMRLGSEDSIEYDNIPPEKACDLSGLEWQADQARKGGHKQGCCSVNDAADARLVSAILGVPFYVMNFKKDFGQVIDYFVDEYNAGRTPNPCVRCNDWLKFGKLHQYAQSIDCDYVASGHYARLVEGQLRRGVDHAKDQSYVLFGTPRERLGQLMLPIGGMEKSRVRELADEWGLPVFGKPDSQEICFVPDQDYARLVEKRTQGGFAPGSVLDMQGNVVGEHAGHQHLTIGQRRGIGVALGYPIYVVNKDPAANTVTVGRKEDTLCSVCVASQTNWLSPEAEKPFGWRHGEVKVRYNMQPVPGSWRFVSDDVFEVRFDEPVEAVTPGQAVVCYEGEVVVGGGWIDRAWRGE
jgi:tRNA-specific 2-thiouridylase